MKGTAPTQPTGAAAQFHARLRGSLPGRTSPKIANPKASKFEDSAIIVVCRKQKQNADREALQMQASLNELDSKRTAGMGDGSVRITDGASQPAKNAGPAKHVGAGGGAGIPAGPLKTESASGNQTPGSGATTSLNSSSSKSAVTGTVPHGICIPNIATISGLPTVVFSPSALFNPYTIKGCGFGNAMGNVYLTGPFYGGKVQLNVQTSGGTRTRPAHAAWNDNAIIVNVDPNVTGELDQENVTLVIEPVGGAPIQKSGNQFLAAREDVPLPTIPQSAVTFFNGVSVPGSGGKKASSPTNSGSTATLSVTNPDLLYFTPSQSPPGMSAEVFRGGTTTFFPTGSDLFDMSGLARGFLAESFQLHQQADPTGCDKGTGGSEGAWNATWSGADNIRVDWKEFQCHLPWMGGGPDVWSEYALSVTVKGPRGIDPWTGRRPLNLVAPTRALAR
jgi:hypothetical protein